MSEIVNAVTKFRQSDETLLKMTERAIKKEIRDFSSMEFSGGLCNAVYLVEADGEKIVLKIAPAENSLIMRHERDITITEAEMLHLFNEKLDIPIPKLIYFDESRTICAVPYFFMSFMQGSPLNTLASPPDESYINMIKREIGVITSKISSLTADCFGIPAMPETFTDNNCDFMLILFRMLLDDAKDKSILIPQITHDELLDLVESQKEALNEVQTPYYIHTDTWDGNIMVYDNRFIGLVDFAAIHYGDPLMNHDFHEFSPEPRRDFLEGYGKINFSDNERIRISIYKIWQRLGMIVERGYRGYEDSGLYSWVLGEFSNEVEVLKELIKSK